MNLQLKRAESFVDHKEYLIVFCLDNNVLVCRTATYGYGTFNCGKTVKDIIDAYELPITPDEYCNLIIEPDNFV